MPSLVKAVSGMKHSVVYTNDSGKHFRYFGGTWAWRNHNPGNIRPGKISEKHHQIGVAYNFAVFPDNVSGHNALLDVLKITYANSSIDQMMKHFAPPKENNTKKYQKFLHDATGVKGNKKIKDFSCEEFENLWKAIEKIEASKIGEIVEVFRVTQIRKQHSQIIYYCLDADNWITKEQCIDLAKEGKVDLEFCVSHLGNTYLRASQYSLFQENLSELRIK